MSLDKIIVLILAIGLFAGVAYLALKSRQTQQGAGKSPSPNFPDSTAKDSPSESKEKARKNTRS